MVRKHLHVVTLEENLEMAADIGIEAGTSLEDAFAAAMARHGLGRQGGGAALRALPAAARCDPHASGGRAHGAGGGVGPVSMPSPGASAAPITGSTTVVELLERFPWRRSG